MVRDVSLTANGSFLATTDLPFGMSSSEDEAEALQDQDTQPLHMHASPALPRHRDVSRSPIQRSMPSEFVTCSPISRSTSAADVTRLSCPKLPMGSGPISYPALATDDETSSEVTHLEDKVQELLDGWPSETNAQMDPVRCDAGLHVQARSAADGLGVADAIFSENMHSGREVLPDTVAPEERGALEDAALAGDTLTTCAHGPLNVSGGSSMFGVVSEDLVLASSQGAARDILRSESCGGSVRVPRKDDGHVDLSHLRQMVETVESARRSRTKVGVSVFLAC
jgi:hypothetical protein